MTSFSPGSIVRARGREWIVQPDLAPPLYTLMPLGSTSDEAVRVHAGLEPVASATFAPPDPSRRGDANACRLLRDAARLATRHAAGPFRSFGRLGFEPRPYQLVPLIMALRLDPVRLLIADDVGIGKTIEALMIARELYDRREVPGFSVLCPPHLAPQWKAELDKRFHIDAELVLASTAQQLERRLAGTETIFQRFPFTVTSLDYVKSERRRREFLQSCPDLVIVDEAHTCTPTGGAGRAARQMRHELLKGLARKEGQHLLLVTATPHSGNHEAYDALLGLLDERFGPGGALSREGSDPKARDRELSRHFIQRRRPDIAAYLGDTRFPQRTESEVAYRLSTVMQALVEDVAAFAERYRQAEASRQVQRTRAWAILTLFQAIASSPAAAAATLAVRSAGAGKAQESDEGAAGAEEQFARPLVDDFLDENDAGDATPSVADFEQEAAREGSAAAMSREARKVFASLARRAAEVSAADDTKLLALQKFLKQHLAKEGNADGGVVVFCRFIATAEYLQRELAKALGSRALVECVVGTMHDSDRTARIEAMAEATEGDGRARVLVCTDCLSEGINLQDAFDTVVHYDLSWNPNRHVQREGRVDRFGQPRERVHVCFFHSEQTVFDQVVMGVLHRKRREIASELGYLVSVPVSRDALLGLILKRASEARRVDRTGWLFSEADLQRADVDAFERECDAMVKAEKALRLRFNQHQIKPEEVEEQVRRVKAALGTGSVEGFTLDSLRRSGLVVEPRPGGGYRLQAPPDASPAVREVVDSTLAPNRQPPPAEHRVRFEDRSMGQTLLTRAHPLVEGLASFVLQSALDPLLVDAGGRAPVAARCGVVATRDVEARTTILVLRTRCQVEAEQRGGGRAEPMLAEDVFALGLEGDLAHPTRIDAERAARLVEAKPAGNLDPARAQRLLEQALAALPDVQQLVRTVAAERAAELARAHDAARSGRKGVAPTRATPTGEPDVLGVFILVPQQAGSAAHGGVA